MVSQKQISTWLPHAIELFNEYMPGLDTESIHFLIAGPKTTEKTRTQIVKELDSPQTDFSPTAMLEFIFGSKGTAIFIKQQYIKDEQQFQKLLWHELGHAYAYQFEYTGCHLIDLTNLVNADLWSNSFFNHGYSFWKEFIAESISCYVASKVYPAGDISDNWYSYKNQLENCLGMALFFYTHTIDESGLAMYFAHMLMGDGEKQFFDKAQNGGLQIVDYHHLSSGIKHRLSEPNEIDPYCLRLLCPPDISIDILQSEIQKAGCQKAGSQDIGMLEQYRETLIKMRELLLPQMNKPDFWSITPDWIVDLGNNIVYIISLKVCGLMNRR